MSDFKVELISSGIVELLHSDGITNECRKQANRIAKTAGDGFEVGEHHAQSRNYFTVYPATAGARKENSENNTLLKSMRS